MSEDRNQYGYPTPAPAEPFPFRETVTIRTVGELRRYLEGLPGEWRVEGRSREETAVRVELLPGFTTPPLVVIDPIVDYSRPGAAHDY